MSQFIKFYFTSMINMFWILIYPSSGACYFSIVSPHWLCVLVSICVGISVWLVGVVSVLQAEACNTDTTPTQPYRNSNTHRTKNKTTDMVIQQNIRKLLIMDILMSEKCWAHKKWNKIASDIKLVFYSSTITMTHGPIYIRIHRCKYTHKNPQFKKSWHKNLLIFKWMLYVKLSISPSKRNCRDVKSTINHTAQCSGVYCVYQLI